MSGNRDLGVSDAADQEIPDRKTANAAQWLTEQGVNLPTHEFWLLAGQLGHYTYQIRSQALGALKSSLAMMKGWVKFPPHGAEPSIALKTTIAEVETAISMAECGDSKMISAALSERERKVQALVEAANGVLNFAARPDNPVRSVLEFRRIQGILRAALSAIEESK